MAEEKNVGSFDAILRILLGLACLSSVIYHFAFEEIMALYALIPVIILIPFFLKTGLTRFCPIMKSLNLKTN